MTGTITRISGSLVVAEGLANARMFDLVIVGSAGLMGEIIKINEDTVFIQVYEETMGVCVGEEITNTQMPLSVELGPGLLSSIYDGVQRPLTELEKSCGSFIERGIRVPALAREKRWYFKPKAKKGDSVEGGDILGAVLEKGISHSILVPVGISGNVEDIKEGDFTVEEPIAQIYSPLTTHHSPITMLQRWPVRKSRPVGEKLPPNIPLLTGQRVLDSFFPIAKGGTSIIPGGFGTGKTVLEQTVAKFCDCDIIVYIGCGERGNEMTSVLTEFPRLEDPRTRKALMDRTILIANTSNMPVAAREASIYVGITLAEYYRDMGYDVAVMADSTSRWAEALREISSRLEEMPSEEGYPPYLASRLSSFYERSGRAVCLGKDKRIGSVTIIGAVSPAGGDFSEPVTQGSLRISGAFWALDTSLAHRRHFPAINWQISYTLYQESLKDWFKNNLNQDWYNLINSISGLLQKEIEIQKVAQVVGIEALPPGERLILESCGMVREIFLQQSAFDPIDCYNSLKRQEAILRILLLFFQAQEVWLKKDKPLEEILEHPVREQLAHLRELEDKEFYLEIEKIKESLKI